MMEASASVGLLLATALEDYNLTIYTSLRLTCTQTTHTNCTNCTENDKPTYADIYYF